MVKREGKLSIIYESRAKEKEDYLNIRMLGHATVHRVGQITTTPQRHNFTVPKPPKTSELFTKTNTYNRKRLVWSYFLFFFCAQTLGKGQAKKRDWQKLRKEVKNGSTLLPNAGAG